MNETIKTNLARHDWDDLAAFLAVARHGGLTAAAREIGSSAPTLGRRMRALELSLNRELFVRKTHGYELTNEGQRLHADLVPIEASITQALISNSPDQLPIVRISAGTWTMMGLLNTLPALVGNPIDVRLRLLQGENKLSLPRREADIGFRRERPQEVGLAGRKLRNVRFAPFAASEAVKQWIVVRVDTPSANWVAKRCGNDIAVETDNPRVALDLALQGFGKMVLPTFIGDNQSGLVRTNEEIDELAHEQWLVMHDEGRRLPQVRRVLDRIRSSF